MKRRSFLKALVWSGLLVKSNLLSASIFVKEKFNQIKTIDIPDESTEGGEVTCFFDGPILLKIRVDHYFESGKYFKEILLNQDGSILRVDEVLTHYNVPFYITDADTKECGIEAFDPKKSKITRNVYFFDNEKVSQVASSSNTPVDLSCIEESCRNRIDFVLNHINDSTFVA